MLNFDSDSVGWLLALAVQNQNSNSTILQQTTNNKQQTTNAKIEFCIT